MQDIYSDENHVLLDETENLNNPVIQKNLPVEGSVNNEIQFRYELEESVHAWSNEDPYLYELLIEVQNEKGETVEVVPYQIGFRKIELKGRKMLLNGKTSDYQWCKPGMNGMPEAEDVLPKLMRNGISMYQTQSYQCSQNLPLSGSYFMVLQM